LIDQVFFESRAGGLKNGQEQTGKNISRKGAKKNKKHFNVILSEAEGS